MPTESQNNSQSSKRSFLDSLPPKMRNILFKYIFTLCGVFLFGFLLKTLCINGPVIDALVYFFLTTSLVFFTGIIGVKVRKESEQLLLKYTVLTQILVLLMFYVTLIEILSKSDASDLVLLLFVSGYITLFIVHPLFIYIRWKK